VEIYLHFLYAFMAWCFKQRDKFTFRRRIRRKSL